MVLLLLFFDVEEQALPHVRSHAADTGSVGVLFVISGRELVLFFITACLAAGAAGPAATMFLEHVSAVSNAGSMATPLRAAKLDPRTLSARRAIRSKLVKCALYLLASAPHRPCVHPAL
jgi:hypothetical protein